MRYDYRCECGHEWRGEKPKGERCPKCASTVTKRVYSTGVLYHPTKGS